MLLHDNGADKASASAALDSAGGRSSALAWIRPEIDHLALATAITGSIANALVRDDPTTGGMRTLLAYQVDPSSVLAQLRDATVRDELVFDTSQTIRNFCSHLLLAGQLTEALHRTVDKTEAQFEAVADAWQRAASAGFVLQHLLDRDCEKAGCQTRSGLRVHSLLKAVSQGASPCIAEDGEIFVPGWAERRATRRLRLNVEAQVSVNGAPFTPALLINASYRGFGISGVTAVMLGDSIDVRIADRLQARGTVVWTKGADCGVNVPGRFDPAALLALAQ